MPPLLGPVLVVDVWVFPPGVTPPELGVEEVVAVLPVLPEEGLDDGLAAAAGVLVVVLVVVDDDCELDCGGLAAAEVGTVSGETPLVFAIVEPPLLPPPQPATAVASRAPVKQTAMRREKPDAIVFTSPAAPSGARSADSRSDLFASAGRTSCRSAGSR